MRGLPRRVGWVCTAAAMLAGSGACRGSADRGDAGASGAATGAAPARPADQPRDSGVGASADLRTLVDSLRRLPGRFEAGRNAFDLRFVGQTGVFAALAKHGDSAVRALADCLDDVRPAAATLRGRPVVTGVMCDEALTSVATYEAADRAGDSDANWPGYVRPDATPEALRAAKRAWSDVVRRRAYVLSSSM